MGFILLLNRCYMGLKFNMGVIGVLLICNMGVITEQHECNVENSNQCIFQNIESPF